MNDAVGGWFGSDFVQSVSYAETLSLTIPSRFPESVFPQSEPFGEYVYAPSYGITTALFTVSLFMFLLSRPKLGGDTPLPRWGKYAVGIYVVHPGVFALIRAGRDVLESMGYNIDQLIVWHLLLTPTLFVASWLVYIAAHKLRLIEIGGTHLPGRPWIRAIRSG